MGWNQAQIAGAGGDAIAVDAASVVFDFDEGAVAAMVGANFDGGDGGFGGAIAGAFDAMGDGVAEEVDEGVVEVLKDGFIDEDLGADDFELGLFAVLEGEVADHAGKALKYIADGEHSGPEEIFADAFEALLFFALDLSKLLGDQAHVSQSFGDLVGEFHEGLEVAVEITVAIHLQGVEAMALGDEGFNLGDLGAIAPEVEAVGEGFEGGESGGEGLDEGVELVGVDLATVLLGDHFAHEVVHAIEALEVDAHHFFALFFAFFYMLFFAVFC